MCLAIPARIVELLEGEACRVDLGGVRKQISLALVDGAAVGDYVIVHVGYALSRLDAEEAENTLALFAEAGLDGPALAAAADEGVEAAPAPASASAASTSAESAALALDPAGPPVAAPDARAAIGRAPLGSTA